MNNIEKIKQEWETMRQRGTLPLFEIEIKGGEYLLVDLEFYTFENGQSEIRFSFDSMNLPTWFSGDVKRYHENCYAIVLDEYAICLNRILELIMEEIQQGFICANQLFAENEV